MKDYVKQVKVKAVQWTGENLEEVKVLAGESAYISPYDSAVLFEASEVIVEIGWMVFIDTDAGILRAMPQEDFDRDFKEVTE